GHVLLPNLRKLSGEACGRGPCCDNEKIDAPAMTEWSRDAALSFRHVHDRRRVRWRRQLAPRRQLWRTGRDLRGEPGRRHLRDPRLRAEKAPRLWRTIC